VNAQVVDVDTHVHNGLRSLMRTNHGLYLVCACPSTGRVYHMEVDPQCQTCEGADTYLRGPALITTRLIGAS
jgi:hypothetical protein